MRLLSTLHSAAVDPPKGHFPYSCLGVTKGTQGPLSCQGSHNSGNGFHQLLVLVRVGRAGLAP
jgi:hypothetical protein